MNIPSGKVTFLFTDIESSTKLSQDFPDKISSAMEKHHSILQTAVESNNGFIFKHVGDAYHCVFGNAYHAVKAAVEIQAAHANEKWDKAVIRVRVGIHSGNAEWNGKDYMGYITLARAARVMSAAYGEQILISGDAYCLLSVSNQPARADREIHNEFITPHAHDFERRQSISFRDLGERRLKDVILPIRLYQITGAGLREDFPPLNTLDARPNNLPIQLTSFIGRETEMKQVKDDLKLNRLVTLASAGGSGKTRLALQLAAEIIDEYENGVWFVDLAALNDPALLTAKVNETLGIKEESKKAIEETLIDFLKEKEILILLDNCEQLVHACAELAEKLLSSCPRLKIIATSREALNCKGEKTFRIPPLTMPDPNSQQTPEQLTQYEAVRLFIERALLVNPEFRVNNGNAPALAGVCSRLDGIPLAIELAAARTKILSVEKIHERLDDRFSLLTGGKRTALPRQQTLKALIDWSYDLLAEEERILWSRLSVFSGGWTLEAAEEICSYETIDKDEILDLLSQLTEKSVIIYDELKERYRMLESIKQYGIEKLPNGDEIFLRHLNYFLGLSQKVEPNIRTGNAKIWLGIIEADHNNFLSAIDWSANNNNSEKGGLVAVGLGEFWSIAGHYSTGIRLIENILQSSAAPDKSLRSKLLSWIGVFKWRHGDYEQSEKYHKENLAIGREIGDKRGIAASLNSLGIVSFYRGDYEQAEKYSKESLAIGKETGDKRGIAVSINNLGNLSFDWGDYDQSEKYFKESLVILEEIGDKRGVAATINNLGNVSYERGDYEQAEKYYKECLAIRKEIGDQRGIAASMGNLGNVSSARGDYEQAEKYHEESLAIRKNIGDKFGFAKSMDNMGNVSFARGDYEQAEKYLKESLAMRKEIGDKRGIAETMNNLGNVSYARGDYELSVKVLSSSEKILQSIGGALGKNDQTKKDEIIAKFQEQLSDKEFNKYWEDGKELTLEEACQLVMSR